MSGSIAIVCEAAADFETVATLADRLILHTHAAAVASPWVDAESLPLYRNWRGFRAADDFLRWSALPELASRYGVGARFSRVKPVEAFAVAALRAVRVLAVSPEPPDAAVFVSDADDDPSRLRGLGQARDYHQRTDERPLPIAVGLPLTKRECWHLCGFRPETDAEHDSADRLRGELGHEPWLRTHELTARHDTDHRSAKRVLAALCGGDRQRELRCLHAPLELLRERGRENGLAAFLNELETHIVPLVLGLPR